MIFEYRTLTLCMIEHVVCVHRRVSWGDDEQNVECIMDDANDSIHCVRI